MTLNTSICPHCGNDHLYKLGDGRYKCSACLRKFSLSGRRSRLTAEAMESIISGFAEGSPASEVATETGLNLKTVQLYYGRIRELLATDRERYLTRNYGSAEVPLDLFDCSDISAKWQNAVFIGCLVDNEAKMDLLFAKEDNIDDTVRLESSTVAGWLVAADRQALENQQLDKILCLPGRGARERARSFCINAKRLLSGYCGGFKKNFKLYIREMEFRNNMENTAAAREQIGELLNRTKNTPTGEDDA